MFCHGYRSVPYSVIFREASSCRRWEQTQRPTAKQCVESKTAENTQLKFGCLHPIPLLRTQATSQNTMLTSVPPTHRGNSLESCGLCSYLVNIPFLLSPVCFLCNVYKFTEQSEQTLLMTSHLAASGGTNTVRFSFYFLS